MYNRPSNTPATMSDSESDNEEEVVRKRFELGNDGRLCTTVYDDDKLKLIEVFRRDDYKQMVEELGEELFVDSQMEKYTRLDRQIESVLSSFGGEIKLDSSIIWGVIGRCTSTEQLESVLSRFSGKNMPDATETILQLADNNQSGPGAKAVSHLLNFYNSCTKPKEMTKLCERVAGFFIMTDQFVFAKSVEESSPTTFSKEFLESCGAYLEMRKFTADDTKSDAYGRLASKFSGDMAKNKTVWYVRARFGDKIDRKYLNEFAEEISFAYAETDNVEGLKWIKKHTARAPWKSSANTLNRAALSGSLNAYDYLCETKSMTDKFTHLSLALAHSSEYTDEVRKTEIQARIGKLGPVDPEIEKFIGELKKDAGEEVAKETIEEEAVAKTPERPDVFTGPSLSASRGRASVRAN